MNKKGMADWVEILMYTFIVLGVFLLIIALAYGSSWFIEKDYDYNCLKNYAKEICSEKGFYFREIIMYPKPYICCSIDRQKEATDFIFLEDELEDCKTKGGWSFRTIK